VVLTFPSNVCRRELDVNKSPTSCARSLAGLSLFATPPALFTMSDPAVASAQQSEVSDVLKEKLIDAEYKIWKKNTPYL
jgi:hypothetical protein